MKKLNDSTGFIKDFIKKNGYPAWNKYILPNKDYNLTNKENSFTAGDSLFIIPIIEENSNFVSSFIVSYTSNPEKIELIKGKHYIYYSRETLQLDTLNADKAALQIAWLNFKIFGYTKFWVTDTLLFQSQYGTKPGQRIIKLNGDSNMIAAGKVASVEICITQPAQSGCSCTDGDLSTCTCAIPNCCWVTDCTVLTFGGGEEMGNWNEGTTYTPVGGGEGTGGNTTYPDPFPCPILQGKEAPLPGCEETGTPPVIPIPQVEWPDEPLYYNPCDTLNKYKEGQDFNAIWQLLKAQVPTRQEHLYIFNNLLETISPTNPVYLAEGVENEFAVYPDTENKFVGCRGWFHNHFADEDSSGLIFSAGDLNILAEQIVRNNDFYQADYKKFMIGVVADSGAQYILMVDDINQFTSWANILFKDESTISAAYFGAKLSQEFLPISVSETEKRFLKLIQNAGLKLFRGSADFRIWTPIALTNNGNNVTAIPCP